MMRSDGYEIPGSVRLLLCASATVAILAGFWLTSGLVGWSAASVALGVRASLPSGVLVRIALWARRRHRIPCPDEPHGSLAASELGALSKRAGCAAPQLVVMEGDGVEAFAVAGFRGNAIVVSHGLLTGRSDERAAVLAHEIAHLQHQDAVLVSVLLIAPMLLLVAAGGIVVGETSIAARVATLGQLTPLMASLLLVLSSALLGIGLFLRPRLEWAADAGAAGLLGDHQGLVAALERRLGELDGAAHCAALAERLRRLQEAPPRPR